MACLSWEQRQSPGWPAPGTQACTPQIWQPEKAAYFPGVTSPQCLPTDLPEPGGFHSAQAGNHGLGLAFLQVSQHLSIQDHHVAGTNWTVQGCHPQPRQQRGQMTHTGLLVHHLERGNSLFFPALLINNAALGAHFQLVWQCSHSASNWGPRKAQDALKFQSSESQTQTRFKTPRSCRNCRKLTTPYAQAFGLTPKMQCYVRVMIHAKHPTPPYCCYIFF